VASLHWNLTSNTDLGSHVCTFVLFYHHGKMTGRVVRVTDCFWWSHLYRPGIPPPLPSGRRRWHLIYLPWIGHTHLTRGHLLCGEPASVCTNCGIPFTVAHIFMSSQYHSVSNVLAFENAVGLAMSIYWTRFYVVLKFYPFMSYWGIMVIFYLYYGLLLLRTLTLPGPFTVQQVWI
jgi:hypothetical protein